MSQEPPSSESTGSLAPGQRVGGGRYELKQFLGKGGMGEVWLAWDSRLEENAALKFLPPDIRNDPAALEDMRRETRKSHQLSHPNIIRIHDLFEADDETPFISMEYVDGPSLAKHKAAQPQRCFTWEAVQPLVRQLCEALEYAHARGVIHRDLKPGNIMLDAGGCLKLADFGIAASLSDLPSRRTGGYGVSGTPAYMSPQQLDGKAPQPADDIYSLGATLYELLTSKPPFHSGDIAHQTRQLAPDSLENRLAELGVSNVVPPEVSSVVAACLAKTPGQRPPSARAVAERIGLELAPAARVEGSLGKQVALMAAMAVLACAVAGAWYSRRPPPDA
ncbi:MAG: serine/threonine-protein kinase, partial [Verrucomicrobiota bacterium]